MGRSVDPTGADYFPTGAVSELPEHDATVAPFFLDKYEVTVGRFRKFMAAYDQWHKVQGNPLPGVGAHPLIAGTGWGESWTPGEENLPIDAATLRTKVTFNTDSCPEVGSIETAPAACVKWFVAFAFCIWDGGRLPTEAEWEYASAGGAQNFLYPWGSQAPSDSLANTSGGPFMPVGSRPAGAGYFGHQDMAGSMLEFTFDWYSETFYLPGACVNCANTTPSSSRSARGGSWIYGGDVLRSAFRSPYPPIYYDINFGFRCARDLP
jgi:formylglycine-generating enzyme required for sulfatase activity